MNFPLTIDTISDFCYNMSLDQTEPKTLLQGNLSGVDVTIVFTRMVWTESAGVIVPSRINIAPEISKIVNLFKMNMDQLDISANPLFVFKNHQNIEMECFQYEVRYFPDETALNAQLVTDEIPVQGKICDIL
jgi:hypothetical protein